MGTEYVIGIRHYLTGNAVMLVAKHFVGLGIRTFALDSPFKEGEGGGFIRIGPAEPLEVGLAKAKLIREFMDLTFGQIIEIWVMECGPDIPSPTFIPLTEHCLKLRTEFDALLAETRKETGTFY